MPIQTHPRIDRSLCGEPSEVAEGRAVVTLRTTAAMAADDEGLVHGGFVFGAADYAAMLAVNDPHVVLGEARTRFTAPVRVGDAVRLDAVRTEVDRRRHVVEVSGTVGDQPVFTGTFTTFVLDHHVLNGRAS